MLGVGTFATAGLAAPVGPHNGMTHNHEQTLKLLGLQLPRPATGHLSTGVALSSVLEDKRQVEVRTTKLEGDLSAAQQLGQQLDRRLRQQISRSTQLKQELATSQATCQDLVNRHHSDTGRLAAAQQGRDAEQRRNAALQAKLECSQQQLQRTKQQCKELHERELHTRRNAGAVQRDAATEGLALKKRVKALEADKQQAAASATDTQQQLTSTAAELQQLQQAHKLQLESWEQQLQQVNNDLTTRVKWCNTLGKAALKLEATNKAVQQQLERSQLDKDALRTRLTALDQKYDSLLESSKQDVAVAMRKADAALAMLRNQHNKEAQQDKDISRMQEQLRDVSKQAVAVAVAAQQEAAATKAEAEVEVAQLNGRVAALQASLGRQQQQNEELRVKVAAAARVSPPRGDMRRLGDQLQRKATECTDLVAKITGLEQWQAAAQQCIGGLMPQLLTSQQQRLSWLCNPAPPAPRSGDVCSD